MFMYWFEIAKLLSILFFSIVVSFLIKKFFINTIQKFTKRTKTGMDDRIISLVSRPLFILVFIFLLYLCLKTFYLSILSYKLIEDIFFLCFVLLVANIISAVFVVLTQEWFKVQKKYEKAPQLIAKATSLFVYLIALIIICLLYTSPSPRD